MKSLRRPAAVARPDDRWRNWAGTARPGRVVTPGAAQQVADEVSRAGREGLQIRMTGTGHSFSAAAVTDGVLLRPGGLFDAARVGLGAPGVLTAVTFRVVPAFLLQAREEPMRWAEVIARLDELTSGKSRSTPSRASRWPMYSPRSAPCSPAGTGGSASRSRSGWRLPMTCGCQPPTAATAPASRCTSTPRRRMKSTSAKWGP
jgi:hypothetical protein